MPKGVRDAGSEGAAESGAGAVPDNSQIVRIYSEGYGLTELDISSLDPVPEEEKLLSDDYVRAKKLGEKEYRNRIAAGEYPFLPALDDILPDCDIMPHKSLGVMEIPVSQIEGTKTRARQNSFAPNFMPLLDENSELGSKWSNLYSTQLDDGFNDPIKVYEYLHRFYVLEGNKRVSVGKFLGAPFISADVTRVMPSHDVLMENPAYAEFLKFFEATGMYEIDCSRPEAYAEIAELLNADFGSPWHADTVRTLKGAYWRFAEAYEAMQGREYDLPTSDAFAVYLKVYIRDVLDHHSHKEVQRRITKIQKELLTESSRENVSLVENADEALNANKVITKTGSRISKVFTNLTYTPKHPLKAAFIYDTGIDESSWTADHEKGRLRLEDAYAGAVVTRCYEKCGNSSSFEEAVADAADWGAEVIFTTTPRQIDDALRAAIKYEDIKFLNCSVNLARQAVRTYYAKLYEAKFLAGIVAGIYSASDGTHRICYCSDYPIYGTVAAINAFAIGAAMTDPAAKIYLDWSAREDSNWWWESVNSGIHVISAVDSMHNSDGSAAQGLCYVEECEPGKGNDLSGRCMITNLATPIWKWGKLYEIIVKTVIDGNYNARPIDKKDRATNYWWGMISGAVDIMLSDNLSPYTRQLVSTLRKDIINGSFNPFDGELRSQDGLIRKDYDRKLSSLDIIKMDWLAENIVGEIPAIDTLKDEAKTTVKISGVSKSKRNSVKKGVGRKILMVADREERSLWDDWTDDTKQWLSDIDLIISAGDLSPEYLEFLVTMLNKPLVYVRGNHDGRYNERPPEGCIDADGKIVEAAGLRILGLGGSMRYKPGAEDMYTESEMKRRIYPLYWRMLADRIAGREYFDILLTHAPCRGYGDMDDLAHTGFECFNDLLNRYKPSLHCFGHVHDQYGDFQRSFEHPSGTRLINACGHYIYEL